MSDDSFLICVYYYSLPEFPNNCMIINDNSLFIRDVLVSNPNNPHIKYGGQYDPHYEYDFAPQFKMCCKPARRKIMSIINNSEYDEIYLLFRTHKSSLSKTSYQCISGYYDVDLEKTSIDPNYEEPVIYAREARFVNLKNAIDLSDYLAKSRNYRFWFSSETRNGAYREYLNYCKEKIDSAQNLFNDYVDITKELDKIFKYYEFEEGPYHICESCMNEKCFLMKRIRKKGKLYHQLPAPIADRINKYYKKAIRIA